MFTNHALYENHVLYYVRCNFKKITSSLYNVLHLKKEDYTILVSGMFVFYCCLLVPVSITTAISAIDTGLGPIMYGPERLIRDFAALTDNNLDKLPPAFTICSSISTKAFTGGIYPFQLLRSDGTPWISVRFHAPEKSAKFHRLTITVRNWLRSPQPVKTIYNFSFRWTRKPYILSMDKSLCSP